MHRQISFSLLELQRCQPLLRPGMVTCLDAIFFRVSLMDNLSEALRKLWLGFLPMAAGLLQDREHRKHA